MNDCDKTFRDAIRIQLENNGVTQETCNKIDALIVSDLATGIGELPEPLYDREQIHATKIIQRCYKKAYSTFRGVMHQQMVAIIGLPVDPMKGNWYAITIRGKERHSSNRAYIYHNRQNLTSHQIKTMIMENDLDALPTLTKQDLIRIDGEGYPLEEIRQEPFFGYALRSGTVIESVGQYRLPKYLQDQLLMRK